MEKPELRNKGVERIALTEEEITWGYEVLEIAKENTEVWAILRRDRKEVGDRRF